MSRCLLALARFAVRRPKRSFKGALVAMPNVGRDSDFNRRRRDMPRRVRL